METNTSAIQPAVQLENPYIYTVRWSAVITGLAVGLGIHLVLLLLGAAAGLAVYGAGERPDGTAVSTATLVWNAVSMLISAMVAGYIAARASGLRRTSDGVMHAVAAWGASMLFFAFLTTSVTGSALSGAFGMAMGNGFSLNAGSNTTVTELMSSFERGDRAATVRILQERFGLSADQANRVADRALAVAGGGTAPDGNATGNVPRGVDEERLNDAAKTASVASAGLSLVILLTLLSGVGGGVLGAHGNLRRSLPGSGTQSRVIRHHTRQATSAS